MTTIRDELAERMHDLDDEALQQRYRTGLLTELAQEVARAEMTLRGLAVPAMDAASGTDEDSEVSEDFVLLTRYWTPTEAFIMQGCLEAQGITALVADANLVQANSLLTIAMNGVRVLVPQSMLAKAREVLDARERGDYRLADDGAQPGDVA